LDGLRDSSKFEELREMWGEMEALPVFRASSQRRLDLSLGFSYYHGVQSLKAALALVFLVFLQLTM
jgi:hypothetical protein